MTKRNNKTFVLEKTWFDRYGYEALVITDEGDVRQWKIQLVEVTP